MKAFEETSGLSFEKKEVWFEATAGGTAGIESFKTADYAYGHGARHMGWGGHGEGCGGFPGLENVVLEGKLEEAIEVRRQRYPEAKHYGFFATEKGMKVTKY